MDIIKIIGVGFATLIVTIMLKEYRKDFAIYSALIGGSIILFYSVNYLKNIIDFLNGLADSGVNSTYIILLIKITGIAILTEFAVSVCKDSGENSIANKVDLGGKIIVISLSIPVISTTLTSLVSLLN